MVSIASPLKGKRVGVVGFNARPIACSAKKAGASVFVSDYWGDDDLSSCCDRWTAVLTPTTGARQRQPLEVPLPVALVNNLLNLVKERQLDMVLIGSGFDDYSEAVEPLEDMGLLVGCSSAQIDKARDFTTLEKLTKKHEINFPKRMIFDTYEEVIEKSATLQFPCIVRPTHSGGGSGIRLATNIDDVAAAFPESIGDEVQPRVIQEYVRGKDASCSVLSSGDLSQSISVQGQLIGMPSAGRNCGFTYCGNYLPSTLNPTIESQIIDVSEKICLDLGLNGSVGLDFVIDEMDKIWLMEVNPRIQGSLELIELAGDVSVTKMHVRAVNGVLPSDRPKLQAGVKMVVYSRQDGVVPNLSIYPNTVDRTPQGVIVNLGDPICTIFEVGPSLKQCYKDASNTASTIQNEIKNLQA